MSQNNIYNFDLNIDNYSINDLKHFFKLYHNENEDEDDDYMDTTLITYDHIDKKGEEIIDKLILDNVNIHYDQKKKLYAFIKQAKEQLKQCIQYEKVTTSAQKQPQNVSYSNPNAYASISNTTTNTNTNPTQMISGMPHFVQKTYNLDTYYPNPIQNIYRTKVLVFNSLFCDEFLYTDTTNNRNGDNGFYTFTLANTIENVVGLKLAALQYPNITPNISDLFGNTKMYIYVDPSHQGIITFPTGYYTTDLFVSEANNLINTTLYGSYDPSGNNPFSVSISATTNQTTITNNNGDVFTLLFDLPDFENRTCGFNFYNFPTYTKYEKYDKLRPNTLGFLMGFRTITHKNASSYTSISVFNISLADYVYFSLNEYSINRTDENIAILPNFFFDKDIFAVIPITSAQYTSTLDSGANYIFKSRNYTGPIDIKKLKVAFYFPDGTQVNLRETPFSFVLECKICYTNPTSKNVGIKEAFVDNTT